MREMLLKLKHENKNVKICVNSFEMIFIEYNKTQQNTTIERNSINTENLSKKRFEKLMFYTVSFKLCFQILLLNMLFNNT